MARKQSTNAFLDSLQILAKKLSHKEYKTVTSSMFRLYMGDKLGYNDSFDPQLMADITAVWEFGREKKDEKQAKLYKLKVLQGGKESDK